MIHRRYISLLLAFSHIVKQETSGTKLGKQVGVECYCWSTCEQTWFVLHLTSLPLLTQCKQVIWETGVTVLFPHRSILLFLHTRCLLTWRGRRHYTNTLFLFICTLSSFCFFDLSMDLADS